MNDEPTAAELLASVHDFIRNHAMPQLEGHAAFHARVAANVVAIVQRELEHGPAQTTAERDRLRGLLGADGSIEELNRELCHRIRAGELDETSESLMDHLWLSTLAKLSIDQPQYAAYREATEKPR